MLPLNSSALPLSGVQPSYNLPASPTQSISYAYNRPNQVASAYQPLTNPLSQQSIQPVPLLNKNRPFTIKEQNDIDKGLKQWWPPLFPDTTTTMSDLLASPGKSGFAAGIIVASPLMLWCSMLLGALTGIATGIIVYRKRKQKNSQILSQLKALPSAIPNTTGTRINLMSLQQPILYNAGNPYPG